MMIRSWPRPVSSASSAERIADSIIASIITSRASRGSASAALASISSVSSCLVERAPVDADADRLAVVDRDPDDRREVLVMALAPTLPGLIRYFASAAAISGYSTSSWWPL